MSELLTIGEVARQAHVSTSTIRFYERRGLLEPDARQSGRRRYRTETLRRLVFIGKLQHARELLALALMCRFDHPATDCQIMGAEIDRRLVD
jgi:hypothetical protein